MTVPITDAEILVWYESLERATCNTNHPERQIIDIVRQLIQHARTERRILTMIDYMSQEERLNIRIPVVATAVVWLAIAGNIQLALRHPKNIGSSSDIAKQFVSSLLAKLHEDGVISSDELTESLRAELRSFSPGESN